MDENRPPYVNVKYQKGNNSKLEKPKVPPRSEKLGVELDENPPILQLLPKSSPTKEGLDKSSCCGCCKTSAISDETKLKLSYRFSIAALIIAILLAIQYCAEEIPINLLVRKLNRMVDDLQPIDCSSVTFRQSETWNKTGGVYIICPESYDKGIKVYCDVTTAGGGWLVFQRRMDGSINFNRNWWAYVTGFGDPKREFWLGLEAVHKLTQDGNYELRIDMTDWRGNKTFAHYGLFNVGGEETKYALYVKDFKGTSVAGDSLSWHNGRQFSSRDNVSDQSTGSCSNDWRHGWWYRTCMDSNLNGKYLQDGLTRHGYGIVWKHYRGLSYSLKKTEMKFRKVKTKSKP